MKAKEENGAITLFTVVSILFFTIVLIGLYASSSNKVKKQQAEISTIQGRYGAQNIDEAYNEAYNDKYNEEYNEVYNNTYNETYNKAENNVENNTIY